MRSYCWNGLNIRMLKLIRSMLHVGMYNRADVV